MAISVKDIQEKVFPTQPTGGYNIEQVDDFLDEISEQLGALVRENIALNSELSKLSDALEEKERALTEAQAKTPDYNEAGYFKNLESAMRESLIGAQRLGALALGRALGLCQQRIRCGGLPALRIAARLCGRIELLLGGAPGADPVLNARIARGHERHQRVKQQLLQNHQQHEKADHRPDEFGDVDAQSVCLPYTVLLSRSYRSAETRSAGRRSSAIRADPWR